MALKNNDIISSFDPDNPANMHKYMALRNIDDPKAARKKLVKERERALKTIKEPKPTKKEPEKKKKSIREEIEETETIEISGPHILTFDTEMDLPEEVCVSTDRKGRIIIETECGYEKVSPTVEKE